MPTHGTDPPPDAPPSGVLPMVPPDSPGGITLDDLSTASGEAGASCDEDAPGCITCGDVALPLTVVEVRHADALCRDAAGREELVAIDLVPPVSPGDLLLVHAGVALEQLDPTRQHD